MDVHPTNLTGCSEIKDKWKLVPDYLKTQGLASEHIISFNYFVNHEIKDIVKANNKVVSNMDPSFYISFSNVKVGSPDFMEGFQELRNHLSGLPITPHECRLRDLTYAATIHVDVEYIRDNQRIKKEKVPIGRIPVMLKSSKCFLSNKTEKELEKMKECPLDPGGYFIVKGQERVILMQEQLMKNRMFVEEVAGEIQCHVTSVTHDSKSRTVVFRKNNIFYVKCNIFTEPIPVSIMMKAFGETSDINIFNLIGCEEEFSEQYICTHMVCVDKEIFTKEQAQWYVGTKLPNRGSSNCDEEDVINVLKHSVISHMPVYNSNFTAKAAFLGLMVRRILLAKKNKKLLDNRDFYGNKRIELAGSLLSLVFEDALKGMNGELKLIIEKNLTKIRSSQFDILKYLKQSIITNAFNYSISTGNWVLKRFKMDRHGVTQPLARLNYLSSIGMMTRINSQFEKSRKISGPRSVQPSQYGMVCLFDTPEGESCGLVKNLALMAHITIESDEQQLITLVNLYGLESIYLVKKDQLYAPEVYLVFINGKLMGVMLDVKKLHRHFLYLRRKGIISRFSSIYIRELLKSVYLNSDGGRLCRPHIIVENGTPLIKKEHIEALDRKEMLFDDFVKQGLIEYLDVYEQYNGLVAVFEKDITMEHTHLELSNFAALGVCAGIIPFSNHNQAPRNTYQCAMGKQAMGLVGYNHMNRMDAVLYSLVYPQKPLVDTKPLKMANFDKLPSGQNAVVAVMSYSGFDIEDAIVINKASLDRGFGRCMVHKTMKTTLKKYQNSQTDRICGPLVDSNTQKPILRHAALDSDGIVAPGELISNKQVLINKQVPTNISTPITNDEVIQGKHFKEVPLTYKNHEPSYVERVMITPNDEELLLIKVLLRQMRVPEVGDKFSSRHGQKGVIGLVAEQEDLPFNEQGIVPDIIMNPHGFPSRMTVGKLFEVIAGKAAALSMETIDSTAYEERDIDKIEKVLMLNDLNYEGEDIFYSGTTGEQLSAYIFSGVVFYQKLKHMVQDKIHARGRGPRCVLTRQPTEGRSRDGGLRLGEMERDCLIGYGASSLLTERLMISSDKCSIDVCGNCGLMGYLKWCQSCQSSQKVATINVPYAFKLLLSELTAMNIRPRIQLESICSEK